MKRLSEGLLRRASESAGVEFIDENGGGPGACKSDQWTVRAIGGQLWGGHIILTSRHQCSSIPIGDAWRQVCAWLACDAAWTPHPTERCADLLGQFLGLPHVHGNLVPDAQSRRAGNGARTDDVLDRRRLRPIPRLALAKSARPTGIASPPPNPQVGKKKL
jgi:hypothetical protein